MSRVTRENFIKYSKKLLEVGCKVCPCCLSDKLEFKTDEEHTEYSLTCKVCGLGVRDHLFSRVKNTWNHRVLDIRELNKITHDIGCEWWDDNEQELITITLGEGGGNE